MQKTSNADSQKIKNTKNTSYVDLLRAANTNFNVMVVKSHFEPRVYQIGSMVNALVCPLVGPSVR